ncbi:MAG: SusC/RagA family TonB-linked outer membrane protein, partial [Bacteroidota bacterium]
MKSNTINMLVAGVDQDGSLVKLTTALEALAKQKNVRFSYRTTDLEAIRVTPFSTKNKSVSNSLNQWLKDTGLRYEKLNKRHYVILPKEKQRELSGSPEPLLHDDSITMPISREPKVWRKELRLTNAAPTPQSLEFSVGGTVIDGSGLGLIGATVMEQGTTNGTVTDLDGKFKLTVSSGKAALQFSYTGYRTKVVPVSNRSNLKNIRLDEDVEELQEVVVIAYGEAKAADVVGSVDQVTAKEIQGLQNNSFETALKGQVAGVQVRTGSGRPDGGSELLVRGVGTSGNNAPLIVIDGVPFGNENTQSNNLLALLNPEDIESVSVIRDASGKALYGSRAGNGLILITTKRGQEGKPTINVSLSTGIETIPDYEKPQMLNATELAQFRAERELDAGTPPDAIPIQFQNPEQYGEGTDWFDLITRTGTRQNANISVRGGTKQSTYSISGGYTNNEGVVRNTAFERYSFRASFNSEITPWLRFNTVINPTQTMSNNPGTDPGTGQFQAYHILQVARWADPSAPAYDADGNLTLTTKGDLLGFWQANPLYRLENNKSTSLNRRIQAQMALEVDILPGLYIKQLAAVNLFFNRSRQFRPGDLVGNGLTPANPDPQSNSRSAAGRYENIRLLSETTLNYTKQFGRSSLTALAGYITEYTEETFLSISGTRLINEDFELFNSGNIARFLESDPEETRIFFGGNESRSEQALISHIGRVQYDFDKKYYLTASLRRDASSRFGPLNRAAYFPALGLAWRVSKEPWFPKGTVLTNARVELSIGQTGNNRIGNYQYQGNVGRADYILGRGDNQAQALGFAVTALPNNELAWEQIDQLDLNLELGFWKGRLNVEATYYEQTTNDLLNTSPIPRASGFGGIVSNVGTISNKGIELQIRSKPIVKEDFVWTIDGNISANRNKVVQLGCCNVPILRGQAGNGTQISYTLAGEPIAQY